MKAVAVLIVLLSLFGAVKADGCADCELVATLLEGWIQTNATEAQVESYLDTFCKWAPANYQATVI